jgi:hypothetical protein
MTPTRTHSMADRRILALWSAPRCRSTAFFRMMLERGDFVAVHEPFSTLAEFGRVELPGGETATGERGLIDALRHLSASKPVFLKDTTDERYPEVLADKDFLATEVCSTFIIRHPEETIPSYYAINPDVQSHQIGMEHLHELFDVVTARTSADPVVVDSDDLIGSPAGTVERYCEEIGIPFNPAALSWEVGDRPEWRATGRWHQDVSRTTGFARQPAQHHTRLSDVPHLAGYLDHHLPYYQDLHRHRLRI